ncbi:XRE family transcriptional regulator [Polyangium sorediatum]|uniref:XRE family transcriptional regulator n=1 Tax=Polyangium sorediatum TaxID=889274 RepID=A0ABT6P109_9BACT|nr:XRE family transcriptional regulator [Polyangium sorediatum]MDI1434263.1 XRE family transcriptional regulator [Polyangium sorediatum]
MFSIPTIVRDARQTAKLSEHAMARLLGLSVDELRRIENAKDEASPVLLDRYAQTFGLSLKRFLAGEARQAPMALLLRSIYAPSLDELANAEAHRVLGEFVRTARDIADLRDVLHEPRDSSLLNTLKARPIDASPPPHGAERLAQSLRAHLDLGLDPIPSMIDLLERRLGVDILWLSPDELDRDIDGASARGPTPAILVNLVGGAELFWRTRMTLAHELCHLVFDRNVLSTGRPRGFVLFSPRPPAGDEEGTRRRSYRRFQLFDDFESIERRASAFAAYFLAPPEGVRQLVGRTDATSEEAIVAVSHHYGVGRETAINVLKNVYRLPPDARRVMLTRRYTPPTPSDHPDVHRGAIGLRAGALQDLVLRALARGAIDSVTARDYLGLGLTDDLPPHPELDDAQRAPLRSPEDKARSRVDRHLQETQENTRLYAAAVTRDPDGFRVDVVDVSERGSPRNAGFIRLTRSFDIAESHIESPAPSSRRDARKRARTSAL